MKNVTRLTENASFFNHPILFFPPTCFLSPFLSFPQSPFFSFVPVLFSPALFSLVDTIAHAVSCCRHFVADHGAESLLPSNFHSVHFMVHIPCSPFVRVPLAPTLISLTPSITNNNKSNAHLFHLPVTALQPLSGFELRWVACVTRRLSRGQNVLHGVIRLCEFCAAVWFSEAVLCCTVLHLLFVVFGSH